MHERTAYIVGAGAFCRTGFDPGPRDLVIAADGGYDALRRAGLPAHLVLGDMDSISAAPGMLGQLRFPRHKDETDLALALRLARSRGFARFKLYGALGGRLDHSLANLHLLAGLASQGLRGVMVDPQALVYAQGPGCLALPPLPKGRLVSVFSWGGTASGVTLKGLKYPLHQARLQATQPLGVSNEALGLPIRVAVQAGVLLVVLQRPPGSRDQA